MHIHIIKGMAILSGLAVGGRYRVYQSKKIASSQAQKIIKKELKKKICIILHSLCSLGWWLVLICYERTVLLTDWWLVLI
jgi:hypothetical protein